MKLKLILFVSSILLTLPFISCNFSNNKRKIVYYQEYDLFKLHGVDSLGKNASKRSVKVEYYNNFPIKIQYFMQDRTVTLLLEDSFYVKYDKPIYIYSTSNLYGGQSGSHNVYLGHQEENKHLVYVSLTDTLLCENQSVPQSANYTFVLFVKQSKNIIVKVAKGESDENKKNSNLSKKELYIKLHELLLEKYRSIIDPIIVKSVPPPNP